MVKNSAVRSATAVAFACSAVLTVAIAAGCGVFRPLAGASGMETQINQGEQVSAATRAHASRPATGPAVRPAAQPAPASVRRKVLGSQVTAIGDSVMAASALALKSALPGIYIDAVPSRQMTAGLQVVRALANSGRLRPVVVIGLGTNYIVTTSQLNELLRLLGPDRKLVLINTYVPDAWSKEVNATEAAFVQRHPDVVLADWFDLISHRTYLLWPDQVHPQLPGTAVYARLVGQAIQSTLGTAPVTTGRVALRAAHRLG